MQAIYIYFDSMVEYDRDVLEDNFDLALEGVGSVSGSGSGEKGSNIDIEIYDRGDLDKALQIVNKVLDTARLRKKAKVDIPN